MSEEQTLPPLLGPAYPALQTPPCNPRKRALRQAECLPPSLAVNSSDPAVFSSDDDASLESYQPSSERRKKRLIGSWYKYYEPVLSADPHERKRDGVAPLSSLQRDCDSGVFLTSDGLSVELDEAAALPPLPLSALARARRTTFVVGRQMSTQEQEARKLIAACVEDGKESIDLSGLILDSLTNDSIAPITTLACIPTVVDGAPFEPRDPEIKIFLSNNLLRQLPGAILDIENLTCLSLRGNKLIQLPSCIGQLKNLETLNVAQNKLRYLPKSLLDLMGGDGKMHNLLIHPNPFLQPETKLTLAIPGSNSSSTSSTSSDDSLYATSTATKTALYLARSAAQYLSTPGYICSRTTLPLHSGPLTMPANGAEIDARCPFVSAPASNSIPSLVELVLRQCYASSHLRSMPKYVDSDRYSDIRRLLETTQDCHDQRGRLCSRCQKHFVMPAVQWVEWWAVADVVSVPVPAETQGQASAKRAVVLSNEEGSIAVPFLAEGCTWSCTPQVIAAGASLEKLRR